MKPVIKKPKLKSTDGKSVRIKAYTQKELSCFYNISRKTMRSWLTAIKNHTGEKIGRYYSNSQVRIIFDIYGVPEMLESA